MFEHGVELALLKYADMKSEEAETRAMDYCKEMGISTDRRIRRKKKMPGEDAADTGLTLQEEIRREQYEILDRLHEEVTQRSHQMTDMNNKFGFLISLTYLMNPTNDGDISTKIECLTDMYDDISAMDLQQEIHRLRRHINTYEETTGKETANWTARDILQYVVKWGFDESFPNLLIILRMFLTLCVSVATCERSFSKLNLIKNYLRSTMSQSRLSNLAILSIERQVAKTINYNEVIDKFASLKARRKL